MAKSEAKINMAHDSYTYTVDVICTDISSFGLTDTTVSPKVYHAKLIIQVDYGTCCE